MTLSIYDRFITQTSSGETIPNAVVTVTKTSGDLAPADLWQDKAGTIRQDNPITASALGRVTFYITPGTYKIVADHGGETITYNDVVISSENLQASRELFIDGVDFTGGVTTELTLSMAPSDINNTIVTFDDAFIGPDKYSLSGTEIVFNTAIPDDTTRVYVWYGVYLSSSYFYNELIDLIDTSAQGNITPFSELTPYIELNEWVEQPPSGGIVYRPLPSALPIAAGPFNSAEWLLANKPSNTNIVNVSDLDVTYGDSGAASANTTALNAIVDTSHDDGITLLINGEVYFSDTWTLDSGQIHLKFINGGKLTYIGTANKPAVVLGSTSVTTLVSVENFWLDCDTTHDWSDDGCVGLRLIRVKYSDISIRRVFNFTSNLQLYGSTPSGSEHNIITINTLFNAKRHIDFYSVVSNGYLNENLFIGGNFQNTSSYDEEIDSTGIVFRAEAGTYFAHNNNVFVKPCFQVGIGHTGTGERVSVRFQNAGVRNRFLACRVEGFNTAVMSVESEVNEITRNNFEALTLINASSGSIKDPFVVYNAGSKGYNNIVRYDGDSGTTEPHWSSGNLLEKTTTYNSGRLITDGIFYQDENSADTLQAGLAEPTSMGILLGNARGAGVWVDADRSKEFRFRAWEAERDNTNIWVTAYDSDGNILTDASSNAPHVTGLGDYSASKFGGSWGSSGGFGSEINFRVSDDTKRIKIILDEGSQFNHLEVLSMPNYRSDTGINVYSGYKYVNVATESPQTARNGWLSPTGAYRFNASPTSASPAFWQCSFGGANPKVWQASEDYVINQLVRLGVNCYVCVVAGTSASSGGPTGTGSGIVDGSVIWDYYAPEANWISGPLTP